MGGVHSIDLSSMPASKICRQIQYAQAERDGQLSRWATVLLEADSARRQSPPDPEARMT